MSAVLRLVIASAALWALRPPSATLSDRAAAGASRAEASPSGFSESGGLLVLGSPASTMIRVPGSIFEMGSTPDEVLEAVVECQREPFAGECTVDLFSNEQPNRTVALSSYWLDRTEVTVAAYARCVALRRCRAVPFDAGAERFDRPSFPVSLVTWDDARDYCSFRGARLPTEAEFERAARGFVRHRFPWGDLPNGHAANHGRLFDQVRFGARVQQRWDATDASDGFSELAPVGSFPAGRTGEGFLDLSGNVAEWSADRYAPAYDPADTKDPEGPPASSGAVARVIRGGSFESAMPWLRAAARGGVEPTVRRPSIGFRCAASDPARRAD